MLPFIFLLKFPNPSDSHINPNCTITLEAGGYREIVQYPACVRAGGRQLEKKRDIFETFFSYLPQDMALLRQESPENGRYAACAAWLDRYYDELRQEALSEETTLTLGVKLITCTGA